MHKFYFLIFMFLLTSCFEEDDIIDPIPVNVSVGKVEMTENYKYQVFFDLETNTSISSNLITDWDLGFECADSGWHVILNSAKMMLAGNTNKTDFESVNGNENVEMIFDPSDSFTDSTAIGNWYSGSDTQESFHYIYIIDRGLDENGNTLGKKKVVFDIQEGNYNIRFADVDGNNEKSNIILKNPAKNYICFSFDNGVVDIEPDKDTYDLLFTKYTTMLLDNSGNPYPYLLTGVLLNSFNVKANIVSTLEFDAILFDNIQNQSLIKQKDIIGYDWKTYDFDLEKYSVDSDKIYVIKDNADNYYKLRFTGFYNATDEKGYPTFEFLKL